jgi:hypothetical protein
VYVWKALPLREEGEKGPAGKYLQHLGQGYLAECTGPAMLVSHG